MRYILFLCCLAFMSACSNVQPTIQDNPMVDLSGYQGITIERYIEPTDGELESMDAYHESDDLIMRTTDMSVYLNQTSPISDTLYVYHY